jgi:hypothetical protein
MSPLLLSPRRGYRPNASNQRGNAMRTMAVVITAMLTLSAIDSQAFAANPDRGYYRGAGSCGGAAYCSYKANKKVKAHSAKSAAK